MTNLLPIFYSNILPIFIAAGMGYALERILRLDIKSITRLAFYVLIPCLTFSSLIENRITGDELSRMIVFITAITVILWVMTWMVARVLRLSRPVESALLLSTMFVNAGNYGVPLNLFAFGEPGQARAIVYLVVSAVLSNSIGVYLAARGRATTRQALLSLGKVPLIYAVLLAGLVSFSGTKLPTPLLSAVALVGRASVPVMLLILGMQLAQTSLTRDIGTISLATFIRLIIAPALAFGLAAVTGLRGVTRQTMIVEASTPTAVTSTILALEFDARPDLVTSVVFLSTLLSPLTLTVVIALVK
ncbi:MAG: AEC family transporter [Anaerolineae bacterium]|jgi:predicted permease|nr:AEC family transporter [Anaerolineae bacterium]MDH7474213.1 AEC family transporter [Anaerolineae bacterium]